MKKLVLMAVISFFAFNVQTYAVTVKVNGTITETNIPGYINVGDLFQITAILNDSQRDALDYHDAQKDYNKGRFYGIVSLSLTFLEGSTGSYSGASIAAGQAGNERINTFDHFSGVDQFGFGFSGSPVVSDDLGENSFYSCGFRIWDSTGLSLNDTGSGQTLAELTRDFQIIKDWIPANGGEFDFNITTNGANSDGADGVVDSIVIVPEPCSLVLLGLGGLVLRRRKA